MHTDKSVWLHGLGSAYLYWLAFLLALEPGNILSALSHGRVLEVHTEALRISIAALLGCTSAPGLIALARRFPFSAQRRGRNLLIHAAGAAGISFTLIVISCFLAAWILMLKPLPTVAEIRGQLASNWLLLTFALGAFAGLIRLLDLFPSRILRTVPVKARGRLSHVDLSTIEWIQSQGNYLALHAGGRSHLIRETMRDFSKRIDHARFIRVHRGIIVDIHRVREIQPLANGDSRLILHGGQSIRASRNYRESIRTRWAEITASS